MNEEIVFPRANLFHTFFFFYFKVALTLLSLNYRDCAVSSVAGPICLTHLCLALV